MPTLVIHAPKRSGKRSFEQILKDSMGPGYIIYEGDEVAFYPNPKPCSRVVLLRNDNSKARSEGRLVKLDPHEEKTPRGKQRYDVYFADAKTVDYKYEKVNRCGVAVILTGDDC